MGAGNVSVPPDPAERRYRELLEHSPDPMCVHADGRVVYVNPAGVRGIGARHADDVLGHLITDFVHPDSVAAMLARIAILQRAGDSTEPSEAVMLRLDGSPVDAEVVSVLTSWDGKPAYQVIFRDLTLIKAAQATLRYQAALVTHATDAIIATSLAGTVTSWNQAAETIYQRSAARALAVPISEAVGAALDPAVIAAGGGVEHATHYAADGTELNIRVAVGGMDDGYVVVCSDHTALRRAEARFQTIVDSLDDGVVVFDSHGRPEWVNPAARHYLGFPPDGTVPNYATLTALSPLCDIDGTPIGGDRRPIAKTTNSGVAIRNEIVGHDRPDGTRRWLSVCCRLLDPGGSRQSGVLLSFTDVTEQRTAQIQLSHQARHDALTGLPNRAYAEAQLSRALQAEPPTLGAVMFVDLDNVKTINDAFGHHAGDTVITVAAQRLRSTLRTEDFLARLGGDEFVALLFGHLDRSAMKRLTDRLHAALAMPMDVAGTLCRITASIGVAEVGPGDPRDTARILRDADAAMYKAKTHRAATHYADH